MNYEINCGINLSFGNHFIRSWLDTDACVLQKYADNRKVWSNLRNVFPHPYSLEDARTWIDHAQGEKPERSFAIANDYEMIGSIGLVYQEDVHSFSAELGYWLAEPFWGRGIMSEAVIVLTEYAFKQWPLMRIFAGPFSHNIASQRVLEKAGFFKEGLLKSHVIKDGQILDQVLYGKTNHRMHDRMPDLVFAGYPC